MLGDTTAALARDIASQVRAPTLLIAGDSSPPLFGCILDVLQGCIPNVSRVAIEGAGHFLNLTKQREFDRAVLQFWSAND
jgi:pimeloyl-ACP methyl ester carboxylesterase